MPGLTQGIIVDGIPRNVVYYQRIVGTVNANISLPTFNVPSDGTYVVSCCLTPTTITTANMTVTVTFRDDNNTVNGILFQFAQQNSAATTAILDANGLGIYASRPYHLRMKGGTTMVIATAGTPTTITYNIEGLVIQLA